MVDCDCADIKPTLVSYTYWKIDGVLMQFSEQSFCPPALGYFKHKIYSNISLNITFFLIMQP